MATFGDTNAVSGGYFYDTHTNSQFWSKYTNFPGGIITDVWVYMGGQGGPTTGKLCLWNGNTLVYQSGSIGIPTGSDVGAGQGWLHVSGLNLYVAPGDLGIGVWTPGSVVWTYDSSGLTYWENNLSSGPTGAGSPSGTEGNGQLFAYVTYQPGNAYVWNGSSWVASGLPNILTAAPSTYTGGVPSVWNGSSWVQGA